MAMNNVKKGVRSVAFFFILEMIFIACYLGIVGAFRDPAVPDVFFVNLAASINGMSVYDFAAGLFYIFSFLNFLFWFVIYYMFKG